MTIESVAQFYLETEVGQEIQKQGIERGIEQGIEQGTISTLTALLRARFGEHAQIPTIAQYLVQGLDENVRIRMVTEAGSLDDLAARLVPAQPAQPAQPTERPQSRPKTRQPGGQVNDRPAST